MSLIKPLYNEELGLSLGMTPLTDQMVAQRYTTWGDSFADGISGEWAQTLVSGGTVISSGGEGLFQTSASATGSVQIYGPTLAYLPGQTGWINSAVRLGDTGSVGNTRRWGRFSISGGIPQEGFAFELIDTTFYATSFKGGVATRVASTSWTKAATAPFTLDTNYLGGEIRFTSNAAYFYINNILRHVASGGTAPITGTLDFPIAVQNINTSGATNRILGVRNIGQGRFGSPGGSVTENGVMATNAMAVSGGTPHDSVDSGNPIKVGGKASTTAPTAVADGDRVNAWFSQNGALNVIQSNATPAGTNIVGKFGIDQTTPGTTNAVQVTNTSIAVTGTFFQATQPVSLATNTPTLIPATTGGLSTFHLVSAATTNATNLKASAGQVYGWFIYNSNAAARKVVFHNTSGTPTAGASVFFSLVIPPSSGANVEFTTGIAFSTGIAITTVTDLTDAGTTAVALNDLIINIFYK